MLYLVATPIGNLGDFSQRGVEVLRNAHWILCEDTRTSKPLLERYEIKTPLVSLHGFNEAKRCEEVGKWLRAGEEVALISDAGTPGLSDPGERLVAYCREEGLKVSAVPGPCAAIMALTISGLPTAPFQFVGFLPKGDGKRKSALQQALLYEGVTVAYESPARLVETLEMIEKLAPEARLAVARELTKIYEEVIGGTAGWLLERWATEPVRGEIVLMIQGTGRHNEWMGLTAEEHVTQLQGYGLSKQEAVKAAAQMRGVPKREVYGELIDN
ncbi:MAG: 16S rRNA (cytidine(1402)-2'-O)-methyltransferase [Parachlamydiales bacterium]